MSVLLKKSLYILLALFLLHSQKLYPEGLRFHGNEQSIEKRTSYDVFSNQRVTFQDSYEINFDISLYLTSEIGNIVRIKSDDHPSVINLFYDGHEDDHLFLLNEEGRSNLISVTLDKQAYPERKWISISISFNAAENLITLAVDNQLYYSEDFSLPSTFSPTIVFGKSDHIIDVPPFAIKNLSIRGNQNEFIFQLKEHKGTLVHDQHGRSVGEVANPQWLINDAYHWKKEAHASFLTVSGSNYHSGRKELYYYNRDSIIVYNTRSGETEIIVFNEPCPVDLKLGTNFIDESNHRLYTYEVYLDSAFTGPTIASLDLDTYTWREESYEQLPMQLHHHTSFYDEFSRKYLIFGGFGNMRFSNTFYEYETENTSWEVFSVHNEGGITPRYFTSMGYDEEINSLYLFGGTGNATGDQLLGREYYYDLYRLDLRSSVLTKKWSVPWTDESLVPVRSMILGNDDTFYTLFYPEHYTESYLRLYQFSLDNGAFNMLGDSIPIYSDKINTHANVYYDEELEMLFAVIHQFEDDIRSELSVYSLAFPPITEEELVAYPTRATSPGKGLMYFIIILSGLFLGLLLWRYRSRKKERSHSPEKGVHAPSPSKTRLRARPNAIFLFGEFTVRDRENKDITYMFSKKLKETFCILLKFSEEEGGVSSQSLSKLLWPETSPQKVKNTRNVTLNRLRKILEEIDGIELIYEKGLFRLDQVEPFYCDYTRYMWLRPLLQNATDYEEFIEIVTRGKFLQNEDDPFYDAMKEHTEKSTEPYLVYAMEHSYTKEEYHTTVELAEAAFHIDPVNDTALTYLIRALQKLKRHDEAKIKYLSFLIEYKNIMGKEYPNPSPFESDSP